MKEEALQKINKMGKIGYILTKICKIIVIIGIVCLIVASVIVIALPKNAVTMGTSEHIVTEVDMKAFGKTLTPEMIQSIQSNSSNGEYQTSFQVNGIEVGGDTVTFDNDVIHFEGSSEMEMTDLHSIFWRFLVLAIELGFVLATFIFAEKLCKAIQTCATPFEENVIKHMKYFAYSLIPWIFGNTSVDVFVSDFSVAGINLPMVIVVLAVLTLTYIFQYGALLQQESDETL